MKVYLVYGPSGEYEDYYEEFLGAFLSKDNARKHAEHWYREHTEPEKYAPMTFKEYKDLNEGYRIGDYEQEGPRDNLGEYSVSDFERMDILAEYNCGWVTWYKPEIKEVDILDFSVNLLKELDIV